MTDCQPKNSNDGKKKKNVQGVLRHPPLFNSRKHG